MHNADTNAQNIDWPFGMTEGGGEWEKSGRGERGGEGRQESRRSRGERGEEKEENEMRRRGDQMFNSYICIYELNF